jgi:hypothetical protein
MSSTQRCSHEVSLTKHAVHQLTVAQVPRSYTPVVYLCIVLFDGAWTDSPAPTVLLLAANGVCMQ